MLTKQTFVRVGIAFLWCTATACSAAAPSAATAVLSPGVSATVVPAATVTLASPTVTPAPLATLTPVSTAAPTASPANPAAVRAAGAFFALSVQDVDASAKWYSEKLGLKIVLQPPPANQSTVIVLEGQGLIVELVQNDDAKPLSQVMPAIPNPELVHGIFKVGVLVDDFEGTVAWLKQKNVPIAFGPYPATATQRANLIIRDNQGNLIQFFAN